MRAFIIMVLVLVLFSCSEKSSTDQVLSSDSVGREDIRLFDILSPAETGIIFKNELTESLAMNGLTYEYYYNGGGLAVADFNNDGMQDLYFISNLHQNKLYVNEGSLSFKDVSIESGTAQVSGYPTGVTTVDINADGWVDMYISCSGKFNDPDKRRNKLLVNQGLNDSGIPTFKEEGAKYGLDLAHFSTQAAFFDYDRDNDLDMVLINHFPDMYTLNNLEKLMDTESPYSGDKLFQNRNGKYVDVSKEAGFVNNRLSYALGIGISDLNNDGWPDIFVSNDYSGKDYLYMNNRDGSFSESVDRSLSHMSFASMGNNIADYNNDGWMDIFTLDMMAEDNYGIKTSLGEMHPERFQILTDAGLHYQYMYNTLQLNQGVHSDSQLPFFSDVAQIGGIMSTDWSWGPLVFDMDNDGYKDLFVGNGIKGDFVNNDFVEYIKIRQKEIMESGRMNTKEYVTSVLSRIPPRMRNNCFYRNLGDLTFEKKNRIWADDMPTCSNGSAYADLDNDGDMDIIVNNSDSESFIYRNNARESLKGNFLQFRLVGPELNPRGIGTKILLKQVDQIQVLDQYLSRGFQSSISSVLHFGLGKDTVVPEVEVIWPDGKKQVLKRVSSNQTIRLVYQESDQEHAFDYPDLATFIDITEKWKITHRHVESEFDDFIRESLLPHKMSMLGPPLTVGDVNNDGLEDFYIGGAKGHSGILYFQTNGTFKILGNQPWQKDLDSEDIDASFFDADNDGDLDLYVVSGSNEDKEGDQNLQDRLYLNSGSNNFTRDTEALPAMAFSGSCVKSVDYDSDGDIDLFIGGRQKPGKYPFPASSSILRNVSVPGKIRFADVTSEIAPALKGMGMVSDASWVDITGDGAADLVVVGEWMSVRVLENKNNHFSDITSQSGLDQETGWWNCITPGDFDGDGDTDLIAGNLGLNYKYKATREKPFEVYAGDFDNNGILEIVLGYYNEGDQLFPLRGRRSLSNQMPSIKRKFFTHDAFGRATLADIYGVENLKSALHYKVTNFATSYIENQGDGHFEVHPLDNRAQISSVNRIIAEDIDEDGNLDILIAGNMYGSESETPRNDAGLGLFLMGDGAGHFIPVPAHRNGLLLKGDVKDIAMISLGKEGKRGILAAKNSDLLQLVEIRESDNSIDKE